MRIKKIAVLMMLAGGLLGCTPGAATASRPAFVDGQRTGMTVRANIAMGFKTKAAAMTAGDVDHYQVQLIDTNTWDMVAEGTPATSNFAIQGVPDGTYVMTVNAFNADNQSISIGGAVQSSNEVTVASPDVTYSGGAASLTIIMALTDGTGEDMAADLTVNDGQPYSGTPLITDQTM